MVCWCGPSFAAAAFDAQSVTDAQLRDGAARLKPELLTKAQILLSRAHYSPGEIDGKPGPNFSKALAAFAGDRGLQSNERLTDEVWRELANFSTDPALIEYTITEADVRGPFLAKIPARMEDMKRLPALSYVSPRERLAEKFHVSEALLGALNPGKKLDNAGEPIMVPNVAQVKLGKIVRIEVNKTDQTLRAFGPDEKLVAFYPVTAGSSEKPAPRGRLKVTTVQKNPTYHYDPKYKFKGVQTNRPFTIQAGPNNPVGAVWIGVSGEGYGLHGTPEPSKIGKTESHGCIRLTNWDALELADAVGKGVPVDFVGDEQERRIARAQAQRPNARKKR
ncbi:L,D-transpeptidase family protein [Rhodoplanes sp. Z2-YC6860]|uniref:L,D-transpeptidase family protein n=1 Tax=Rhodoplanes sp. Z2-YC6860 TaxID=674703 RepID=UPI001F1A86AF|nr:L,D-transpeptidase [Rhodoplanes sp. Z2-YC6860]